MPVCARTSPEPLSGTPALRLAVSDGGPDLSTRAEPDRPLDEVRAPVIAPDRLSFDPGIPNAARIYGYWLGGKDCYEADRKAAEDVIRLRTQVVVGARAN